MQQLLASSICTPKAPTLRDWAAVGFRQGRVILFSFLIIFAGVVLITFISPRQYEAELKILVKRERAETLVSPDQNAQTSVQPELTEQDLNSEVELLKSRDLLEKVAIASGLASGDNTEMFRATRDLDKNLKVEPLKKTKLIRITYRSTDPYRAATILQTLSRLYFEKHLEVHRPPGALDFFQTQTGGYRKQLAEAESSVAKFGNDRGVVAAPLAKEITVRKLNEFEAELRQTGAAVTETERRIHALEQQRASTPPRLTTQVRTSPNPLLLQQLKSMLLNLELKRTELLSKFAPDYRPVQEVEAEIARTREALADAEKNPVREETTDRDMTHEWLTSELAKARAEFSALQARVAATSQIVDSYREHARKLNETEIAQRDLIRTAKTAEENFLLYSRKQEEARISDALDRQRIVNVSIAQPPTAPAFPSSPNWPLNMALGALLSGLISVALGLTMDYTDRSFRTPDEVEVFLSVPVLAYLPRNCDSRG